MLTNGARLAVLLCVLCTASIAAAQSRSPFDKTCTTEDIAALTQQIADLSAQVQREATQSRTELGASIAGVAGQVDGVSGELDGVSGQVDGVSTQVDGLSGQVDGVSGQVADLVGGQIRIRMIELYRDNVKRDLSVVLRCDEPYEVLALFYVGPVSPPPGYKMQFRYLGGGIGGGSYIIGQGASNATASQSSKEMLFGFGKVAPLGFAPDSGIKVEGVWISSETENPTTMVDQTWIAIVKTVEDADCDLTLHSVDPQCFLDEHCPPEFRCNDFGRCSAVPCLNDGDCPDGMTCEDLFCRLP
jgi:hypothetical protein